MIPKYVLYLLFSVTQFLLVIKVRELHARLDAVEIEIVLQSMRTMDPVPECRLRSVP